MSTAVISRAIFTCPGRAEPGLLGLTVVIACEPLKHNLSKLLLAIQHLFFLCFIVLLAPQNPTVVYLWEFDAH